MALKMKVKKAMPDNFRSEFETKIGRKFANPKLLWEALQGPEAALKKIGDRKTEDGNKKMAMLGDLYDSARRFLNEWFESDTSRKAGNAVSCSVGNNGYLDMCGRENGLQKYINLHRGFGKGVVPLRTMCATVEALVGAVFRGAGERLEAAKVAMRAWA